MVDVEIEILERQLVSNVLTELGVLSTSRRLNTAPNDIPVTTSIVLTFNHHHNQHTNQSTYTIPLWSPSKPIKLHSPLQPFTHSKILRPLPYPASLRNFHLHGSCGESSDVDDFPSWQVTRGTRIFGSDCATQRAPLRCGLNAETGQNAQHNFRCASNLLISYRRFLHHLHVTPILDFSGQSAHSRGAGTCYMISDWRHYAAHTWRPDWLF